MAETYFLGDDERLFKDSLTKLLADWSDAERRKAAASEPGYSRAVWKKLADAGALGAFLPEAAGGIGGNGLSLMVAMEAFGKACFPSPYPWTVAAAGALLSSGGDAGSTLLGRIASGDAIATVAFHEPKSRYDLNHVETRAEKKGSGYVLSGKKTAVPYGGGADCVLVPARVSGDVRDASGIGLFMVDPKAKGVKVSSYATVDSGRAADIELSGVEAAGVLGTPGKAHAELQRAADLTSLALCAEAVGHMRALLDMTVAYTKTRQQFGVAISTFQALQHRMVDMFAATETAASNVQAALARIAAPSSAVDERTAVLTRIVTDKSARLVGQDAVQIHGGMGMTDDLIVGHHFKRLTLLQLALADAGKLMERYRSLEEGVAA
ncbi:MAG: acyl-CoA dehydrogenase family protein [Hyphomicrobiaceae bacterium]